MRAASITFSDLLATGVTTLCRLYRITPTNAMRETLYITDHDQAIDFDGHTYLSGADGVTGTAIDNAVGSANTNFDISVLLGSLISRSEIERGIYRKAAVEIDAVFWDHVDDAGACPLAVGQVADATMSDRYLATLSIQGKSINSTRTLTETYSPTCRAEFCDHRCSLDIAAFTSLPLVVGSVSGTLTFGADDLHSGTDYYKLGHVTWLTGFNAGRVTDVIASDDTTVKLLVRPPFQIVVGDTFTISRGCAKTVAACKGYDNFINYRGEPYVPGSDFVTSPIQASPPTEAAQAPSALPESWDWRAL